MNKSERKSNETYVMEKSGLQERRAKFCGQQQGLPGSSQCGGMGGSGGICGYKKTDHKCTAAEKKWE